MFTIFKDPKYEAEPTAGRPGWSHRSLYTSPVLLEEYLRLSSTDSYPGAEPEHDPVVAMYVSCLDHLRTGAIRNMVSLGPGDGQVDARLLRHLRDFSSPIDYIPVDISTRLLELAAAHAAEVVGVPFAVCADFEEDTHFTVDLLKRKREGLVLWSLLGNTIGALDKGEANFFQNVRPLFQLDDYFLLSVTNHPFQITADPPLWEALCRLVWCLSAIQKGGGNLGPTVCDPRGITLRTRNETAPAASAVEFVDEDGDRTVLTVRSYLLEELLEWLLARLPLRLIAQDRFRPSEAAFGISTALFRVV
jgi:hypothetical protein